MLKDIIFNAIPRATPRFPLSPESFDLKIPLDEIRLISKVDKRINVRKVELNIRHKGKDYPCGRIELYHSGTIDNYELTLESAEALASEICLRFNNFVLSGQQEFQF